jgi:hypothetical protein
MLRRTRRRDKFRLRTGGYDETGPHSIKTSSCAKAPADKTAGQVDLRRKRPVGYGPFLCGWKKGTPLQSEEGELFGLGLIFTTVVDGQYGVSL